MAGPNQLAGAWRLLHKYGIAKWRTVVKGRFGPVVQATARGRRSRQRVAQRRKALCATGRFPTRYVRSLYVDSFSEFVTMHIQKWEARRESEYASQLARSKKMSDEKIGLENLPVLSDDPLFWGPKSFEPGLDAFNHAAY